MEMKRGRWNKNRKDIKKNDTTPFKTLKTKIVDV